MQVYGSGMGTLSAVTSRLIGRAELVLLLGVSRSRAVELSDGLDFPRPRSRLVMGNIWELDDVIAWADARGRTLNLEALTAPSRPALGFNLGADPQSKRKP